MSAPFKKEERIFTRNFLKLYQTLPALWQISSKSYSDKEKKNEAYNILLGKYREKYPNASRDDVRKRINTLRTNYRKELKRMEIDNKYFTKLWYFNDIQFLNGSMEPFLKSESSSYKIKVCVPGDDYEKAIEQNPVEEIQPLEVCENSMRWQWTGNESGPNQTEPKGLKEEELAQLARVWANDLSKVNGQQQMFAKKAIFDILFEAQMGTLHRHSVKIN